MRIQMAEGAAIKVETGLIVRNSYISGCDDMWKGIGTEYFSNLNVYSSVIEDAEFAILLRSWTGFHCEKTDFINNYIGIAVGSPFEAVEFDTQILQRGTVFGCRFFTNGTLPDPYPGQEYYPSWPSSLYIPYDQGFAAVYIAGAGGLNIGFVGAEGADRNKVFNMRNGVIMMYAVGDIAGTDFYDFEGTQSKLVGDPLLDLNQFGIHNFFVASKIEDNTMDNLIVGIRSDMAYMQVINNTIETLLTQGLLSRTRGIEVTRPQTLTIESNYIYEGYYGIWLRDATTPFAIRLNTMERQIPAAGNSAIELVNCTANMINNAVVKGNNIDIIDGIESFGIHIKGSQKVAVDYNNIDFMEDEGAGAINRGISIDGSGSCIVSRNNIFATSGYKVSSSENFGIEFFSSAQNSLHCNTMDNFEFNLRFLSPSVSTKITSNTFDDALRALVLTGGVMLGTQRHHQNEWTENPYSEYGAFIDAPDAPGIAPLNLFIYDDTYNTDLKPNPIGPSSVSSGIWFRFEEDMGPVALDCQTPIPNPATDPDSLEKLVLTEFGFEDFNEELTWLMKADAFEIMLLDPSLNSNTNLDSFFDAESVYALGKLVRWQLDLASWFGENTVDKGLTQDTLWYLSRDLVYIDSVLAEKPVDSASWMALRELKLDTLIDALDEWFTYLDAEISISLDTFEDLADSLNNLTTSNDLEDFLKEALLFKTDYLLGNTFSSGDSSDIFDLTQLCPWEGGRAISIAQAMYAAIVDTSLTPILDNCPSPSPYKGRPDNYRPDEDLSVAVTPNPTKDQITITTDSRIVDVFVSNGNMKLLNRTQPMKRTAKIDLSDLPSGMYILTVLTDTGISTQRVMLVK